jgi:hypothetical protein
MTGPRGIRVRRHVDMENAPPVQREYEEYVKHVERHGRHREEVDCDGAGEMRSKERPPCRRRRPTGSAGPLRHVLGDRVLADVVTELGEFSGDAPTAPRRVLPGHELNQLDNLGRDRRPATRARLVRPEPRESATMPRDHRRRFHDGKHVRPSRPRPRQDDPESSVDGTKPRSGSASHERRELLAERQVLGDEARPRAEGREERTNDRRDERQHRRNDRGPRPPCHRRIGSADGVGWRAVRPRMLASDSCTSRETSTSPRQACPGARGFGARALARLVRKARASGPQLGRHCRTRGQERRGVRVTLPLRAPFDLPPRPWTFGLCRKRGDL